MNSNIEDVFEFVNYRKALHNQIQQARHKKDMALEIYYNGGYFTVNQSLISFVGLICETKKLEQLVLLDNRDTPISVEPKKFFDDITDTYFRALNDYHAEFARLREARDIKGILDIDE